MLVKIFCIIVCLFTIYAVSFGQNSRQTKVVNVGVVNKKALILPKPQMVTLSHFRINEEQIVAVQIVIDESGKVISTDAIFGHALLKQGCEFAARQAKFSPTLINGSRILIRALLIYKFKPDRTIETDIEKEDEMILGKPTNLISPPDVSCNCKFGSDPVILVQTEIDGQGNVISATAISGHPALRQVSEQATRASKFLPINLKTKLIISYSFTVAGRWSVKYSSFEIKDVRILN